MPDILGKEVTRWPDELCGSCKAECCDLIAALQHLEIETVSGFRVFACIGYVADEESPYYGLHELRDKAHNKRAEMHSALAELRRLISTGKSHA